MIRKFLAFAIDKSALNHTLFALVLVASVFAYMRIPKEIFPPIDLHRVEIRGGYAGAGAQILERIAVKPLEDELKSIPDIDRIESVIKHGSFVILAHMKDGADELLVLNDVKERIERIKKDLPKDMDTPAATILKKSFPLALVAIASQSLDKERLLEIADELKSELADIRELGAIDLRGYQKKEIRIRPDITRLRAYGLRLDELVRAIGDLSYIYPLGRIEQEGEHLFLTSYGGPKSKEELAETILAVGQKRVRLGDVALVEYGLSEPDTISHFNGKPNISINVTKTKEGNAIELVRRIREILADFEKRYPGVELSVYTDTSVWIRNRLNTVTSNLLFGLILVFGALLLSVEWRIAVVVGMGIPVSFMIGLVFLDIFGYSLNMLSLFGALIALGMLVDEAIVVAENIYRHLENGDEPRRAAIEGAAEMFPAVLTATATTIFAFLPLLIISGEMGAFIEILPVIISILLLSSLFEAFYFLPLHAKDILRPASARRPSPLWQRLGRVYEATLLRLLARPRRYAALIIAAILVLSALLGSQMKFQLFPYFDTTQIYVAGSLDPHYTITESEELIRPVEEALLRHLDPKEVKSVTTIVGMKLDAKNEPDIAPTNFHIFINLHELEPKSFVDRFITPLFSFEYDDSDMIRKRYANEIAKDIKKIVAPFAKAPVRELSVIVPQAGIVKSDVEIALEYEDKERVLEAIELLKIALAKIPGVSDITDDATMGAQELRLRPTDYAQRLGVDEGYLGRFLRALYLDAEYAKVFVGEDLVYVRLAEAQRDSIERFLDLRVDLPGGGDAPLRDLARLERFERFAQIIKENGRKIRTVYATLDKEIITSKELYERLAPVLERIEKMGIGVRIKGEQKENEKLIREITYAFVIASILIFAALVWMFDSVVLSLIVLSVIPLSVFGVLVGHIIMGLNLTMPGMLGLVGLAGVVVNDGLIMLDFIRRAKDPRQIAARARLRLRPVLLTSVTTILGLSTLMLFASGQSLILQPMAVTLGFGIAWATVVNLLIVPLLYASLRRS